MFNLIYDYVCVGSDMTAGSCKRFDKPEITTAVMGNLFTDHTFANAFWKERGIPKRPNRYEEMWSTPKKSWKDAYEIHQNNIKKRYNGSYPFR